MQVSLFPSPTSGSDDLESAYRLVEAGIFDYCIEYINNNPFNAVTKEAFWVVCNTIEKSDTEMKLDLIRKHNIASELPNMIDDCKNEMKILKIVLVASHKILSLHTFFPKVSLIL